MSIAIPKRENGEMELITSSQCVRESQVSAGKALGVPANRIVARVKRIGECCVCVCVCVCVGGWVCGHVCCVCL